MKGTQEFIIRPLFVGLIIFAITAILIGGISLLASVFGNVVYLILAVIVFAWFFGFALLAIRG